MFSTQPTVTHKNLPLFLIQTQTARLGLLKYLYESSLLKKPRQSRLLMDLKNSISYASISLAEGMSETFFQRMIAKTQNFDSTDISWWCNLSAEWCMSETNRNLHRFLKTFILVLAHVWSKMIGLDKNHYVNNNVLNIYHKCNKFVHLFTVNLYL